MWTSYNIVFFQLLVLSTYQTTDFINYTTFDCSACLSLFISVHATRDEEISLYNQINEKEFGYEVMLSSWSMRCNCCICVCVYARVHHQWQHLCLSVWLCGVEAETHQAVLTCNSDELCKSSMKLNLRLGPQHTHTHTNSPLMVALITHDPLSVCVCVCVYVCSKLLTHSLSGLAICASVFTRCTGLLLWFMFALTVWRVAWLRIHDSMTSWILHRYDSVCTYVCVCSCISFASIFLHIMYTAPPWPFE